MVIGNGLGLLILYSDNSLNIRKYILALTFCHLVLEIYFNLVSRFRINNVDFNFSLCQSIHSNVTDDVLTVTPVNFNGRKKKEKRAN